MRRSFQCCSPIALALLELAPHRVRPFPSCASAWAYLRHSPMGKPHSGWIKKKSFTSVLLLMETHFGKSHATQPTAAALLHSLGYLPACSMLPCIGAHLCSLLRHCAEELPFLAMWLLYLMTMQWNIIPCA